MIPVLTIAQSTTETTEASLSIDSNTNKEKEKENPYSRTLSERIAGYVLTGGGVVMTGLGLVFKENSRFEKLYAGTASIHCGF